MTTAPSEPSTGLWMYRGLWGVLSKYFRVPQDPPTPPVQANEQYNSFKPAPGYLRYLRIGFLIGIVIINILLLVPAIALTIIVWPWGLFALIPVSLLALGLTMLGYLALHLRYDTTWYILTDRALRLRRGIWTIHETTITFENVQNVKVSQGPLQRVFGIANVVVETAGSGGGGQQQQQQAGSMANQGLIEGVSNAEQIRDRILSRLRHSTSTGLGDEVDQSQTPSSATWSEQHLQVLREIRDELAEIETA